MNTFATINDFGGIRNSWKRILITLVVGLMMNSASAQQAYFSDNILYVPVVEGGGGKYDVELTFNPVTGDFVLTKLVNANAGSAPQAVYVENTGIFTIPLISFNGNRYAARLALSSVTPVTFKATDIVVVDDNNKPTISATTQSQSTTGTTLTLPLANINQLQYIGGFRIPPNDYGQSGTYYAQGPIAVVPGGSSMFIVGKVIDQAIAEISIPQLVNENTNLINLNTASVLQSFRKVLNLPSTGNTQNINRIGGMAYIEGKLLVNAFEYYDADVSVTDTTLVINDASNLGGSSVDGYYKLDARAHASGWISLIPTDLQGVLGGKYITGNSAGTPIISRHSVGPSAFVVNPQTQIIGVTPGATISTTKLMDFSLQNPAGDIQNQGINYLDNINRTNDLWTRISDAAYGFIVPGTRTYMTIGWSGGHTSGVGYKITQDTGRVCGGPCSYVQSDNYNYYWLWDLNDLIAVKNGQTNPYDVLPHSYGKFNAPFQGSSLRKIVGGSLDDQKGILYLALENADWESQYRPTPVIIAYQLPTTSTTPPSDTTN